MNNPSGTDWKRLEAMTDEDIDTSDVPELGDDFFDRAVVRRPLNSIGVNLEPEVDAWLQAHGHEHGPEINQKLRELMEAYAEAS